MGRKIVAVAAKAMPADAKASTFSGLIVHACEASRMPMAVGMHA
jgi:hypothetical protein